MPTANRQNFRPATAGPLLVGGLGALLLTVTIGLTIPRALEPTTHLIAVLGAAAPGGLATGLFATLLFAAAVVMRMHIAAVLATALSVALVTVHLAWLAPQFTGTPPQAASAASIVVMVQNFEYGDVADLARVVRERDVDLLVLVDVTRRQQAEVAASSLASRFGPIDQTDNSSRTLVLSRMPLSGFATLTQDGRSSEQIVNSSAVGPFGLIAAHPVPPYADGTQKWREQLTAVATAADLASRTHNGSIMLLGDLNATVDQQPLRDLLDRGGLRDAAEMANAGWSPTYPANGMRTTKGLRLPPVVAIDHVLLGSAFTIIGVQRVSLTGADHLGVVARVAKAA